MLDEATQQPRLGQVGKEGVRPIAPFGLKSFGVVNHHPQKRARECLRDRLLVNGVLVDSGTYVAEIEDGSYATVRVLIQGSPDGGACLTWLTDEWPQATGQHLLCGPVPPDDVQAAPEWPIKRGCAQQRFTCHALNRTRPFRLECAKSLGFPRDLTTPPVQTADGTRAARRRTADVDPEH